MNPAKTLNHLVYTSLLFSLLMILFRMIYSQHFYGTYLIWNLFLAWIPFALSVLLRQHGIKKRWVLYGVLVTWLLFLPNAPYIITDLVHLRPRYPVPYWYDLVLLFWSAWNGLLMGFISLMNVEHTLARHCKPTAVKAIINCCVILCAFGVYAGRFLRWNSWDVVAQPMDLASDIKWMLLKPLDNLRTVAVTLMFAALLMIGYRTLRQIGNPIQ